MMQEPAENLGSNRWLVALHLVVIGAGLWILYANPRAITGDGKTRFDSLTELLDHRNLHRGDRPNEYSIVGPLISAPLHVLGHYVQTPDWWCARFNFLILFICLIDLWISLRRTFSGVDLSRFLLLVALATMFPRHQADYYGEVFTACLAAVGIARIGTNNSLHGWFLLIVATLNSPGTGLGLLLVAMCCAWESRRFRYFLAPIIAVLLIGLEAWIRRGNPALTGYEENGSRGNFMPYSDRLWFNHPFFFGFVSILFSFGKGILWFHPGLFFGITDRQRETEAPVKKIWLLWMLYLAGIVIVYSKWWCWWGGWFWGPRFFLFAAFPAALALARRLGTLKTNSTAINVFLLIAVTLSFWVGANGLVFDQANLNIFLAEHTAHEAYMWHVPEFSVLWFPFVDPKTPLSSLDRATLGFFAIACFVIVLPILVELLKRAASLLRSDEASHINLWKWNF